MKTIEPHLLSSEREIVEFLTDLKASGRIRAASDYSLIVDIGLKEFFNRVVEELSSDA